MTSTGRLPLVERTAARVRFPPPPLSPSIGAIAVCGIQTNFCCETTARIGCDLGYDVWFVLDATHTFDDTAPDGEVVPAAEIGRMTGINLQDEFAEVVTTAAACA